MARRLNVLYKCIKFRWNTSNGYQIIERTRNGIANDQRVIIQKNIQSRVIVLVHDTLSECAFQMYKASSKYLLRFSSYRVDTILWRTDGRTQGKIQGGRQSRRLSSRVNPFACYVNNAPENVACWNLLLNVTVYVKVSFQHADKQCAPWSDCALRNKLICVLTVCYRVFKEPADDSQQTTIRREWEWKC